MGIELVLSGPFPLSMTITSQANVLLISCSFNRVPLHLNAVARGFCWDWSLSLSSVSLEINSPSTSFKRIDEKDCNYLKNRNPKRRKKVFKFLCDYWTHPQSKRQLFIVSLCMCIYIYIYIYILIYKLANHIVNQLKGFLFNSYNTEVLEKVLLLALNCSTYP